ncbi:MAG: peptidylprolyl isomerase [Pyrinomonadaceae bacterium]
MKFCLCFAISLWCAIAIATTARAQDAKPSPPFGNPATEAKKANARPASASSPAGEPFDKSSVEQLAAQCVTLQTESGTIVAEMLPETAPETVRNFLNLAATHAFDSTTFSRVVKDFVIQGGNLATRANLTPELARRAARTILDEPNNVKHERGILSMARSDKPDSATTSFFILVSEGAHLDGKFAAFGRVVRGMDIVDAINHAPLDAEKPLKPVRLTRAVVAPCEPGVRQTSSQSQTPQL